MSPRPRRAGGSVLALVLVLLVVAGPAHAGAPNPTALPATFAGMVSDDAFAQVPALQAATLRAERRQGVGLLRQLFDWGWIEPRPGVFNFTATDAFVLDAARAHIAVLPVLFGGAAWASARPVGNRTHGTFPPRSAARFAAFAQAIAVRYGRHGTLWAAHPDVARLPVTSYQVWNEPSLALDWLPRPDPKAYVRLLRATRTAVRRADPHASIVLAGMPVTSHLGTSLTTYLGRLYAAGARGLFDVVGVHAYATSGAGTVRLLTGVRRALDAHRDAQVGLWVTEFGWADRGPAARYRVGATRQASLLAATIRALGRARRSLRLQGFVYYGWRDLAPYAGRTDFWGLHTGLYRRDGHAKRAAAAYRTAVGALR